MRRFLCAVFAIVVLASCLVGVADGYAQAACPLPASNGTGNGCDAGDICMWKNDPKDNSVANPKNAIAFYYDYCWYNTPWTLHDSLTIVRSRWATNPAVYSNENYNLSNPGYNACLSFNVEYDLKNYSWANSGGKSMNDSVDSHRIPLAGYYCP